MPKSIFKKVARGQLTKLRLQKRLQENQDLIERFFSYYCSEFERYNNRLEEQQEILEEASTEASTAIHEVGQLQFRLNDVEAAVKELQQIITTLIEREHRIATSPSTDKPCAADDEEEIEF